MAKILILATSRKTRGGITAVVKAHETGEQWKRFHCHWIQTHRDGNNLRKFVYLAWAWLDFLVHIWFYDIIHIHFSLKQSARRKVPFVKFAKRLGKKVIVHLHCGSQIDDIWNEKYEYLFFVADVGLFLSQRLLNMVESHMGKGHDYRVCYNPCPMIDLKPRLVKKKQILFSGTLSTGKGYQDLIRSFAKIADEHRDWCVVLAGNGEIERGKVFAEKLGIKDQIKFLGWVSGEEKDRIFRESSILCLPSYAEGFPMAVLDAWAYGLPVITTPVGGIPDIAVNGKNMLLFTPGDIDGLAIQLNKMISNKHLRDSIAKESLRIAHTTFNTDTINKQLGDIYDYLNDKIYRQHNDQNFSR